MSKLPADDGSPPRRSPEGESRVAASDTPADRQGPESWQAVFDDAESGLRRFLTTKLPQAADVDDCLQAVYVAMLGNRKPIPAAARKAWLFRVAANEAARWWRDRATADRVMQRYSDTAESGPTASGDALEQEETRQRIRQAIETLPESTRHIIQLRIGDALTFQTIADRLDLPLGTVLTRMRRGLDRLRNELDLTEGDEGPSGLL